MLTLLTLCTDSVRGKLVRERADSHQELGLLEVSRAQLPTA